MKANKVILNGETVIDLTADTVTADKLLVGETAHDKSGNQIVGTLVAGGGGAVTLFTPSISLQSVTSVLTITDDNGGFVQGYNIYSNDNLITVLTSKTATLTDYIEHTETIEVKVQAVGANFNPSDYAVVEWKYVNVAGTHGLAYSIAGNVATCDGIGDAVVTDIEIASIYEGVPVTSFGWQAFKGEAITSVVISDSVTLINDNTFNSCKNLKSVYIGSNVNTIGSSAFANCGSLTSVTIPASVNNCGYEAFNNCSSLKGVYITDLTSWCNISFNTAMSNPLFYAKNLYLNDDLLTDLVIPNDVTTIGKYAFCGYSGTNAVISDAVSSIGERAFQQSKLQSIVIGKSVSTIGTAVFANCNDLIKVDFSKHTSVPTLSNKNAFPTNSSLQIKVPASLIVEWKGATNWCDIPNVDSVIVEKFDDEV